MPPLAQRIVGAVVLLAAGGFSLPLSALFFDGPATENWVLPIQLAAMAMIGAGLTIALPALARVGDGTLRRGLIGVGWGILAALLGVGVFWFLLNGFSGA